MKTKKKIPNYTCAGNRVEYCVPSTEEIGMHFLTQEELDSQDIYLCANDKEKISIRNLLKLLRSINSKHFDLVIKEIKK